MERALLPFKPLFHPIIKGGNPVNFNSCSWIRLCYRHLRTHL